MKSKVTINVIGETPEIEAFVRLCAFIQSFGSYGMSRCVHVNTDGDGSGDLAFFDEKGEPFPTIPIQQLRRIENELGEYNVDIGE